MKISGQVTGWAVLEISMTPCSGCPSCFMTSSLTWQVADAAGAFVLFAPLTCLCCPRSPHPVVDRCSNLTGGGNGWGVRHCGAAADCVSSFEVVTLAEGLAKRVDAETDAELFWGLKGAGECGKCGKCSSGEDGKSWRLKDREGEREGGRNGERGREVG